LPWLRLPWKTRGDDLRRFPCKLNQEVETVSLSKDIDAAVALARVAAGRLEAAGRPEIGRLAFAALEAALPALIYSAEVSPVLHAAVVMDAAAQASISDGLSDFEATVLCVIGPCHDMCLGVADWALGLSPRPTDVPKKVAAQDVKEASTERKRVLLEAGAQQRLLHNEAFERQAPALLAAAGLRCGVPVDPALPGRVARLGGRHDLPSIAELKRQAGEPIGPADLFEPGERLELLFRGFDRYWMVTDEGVAVDVARATATNKPKDAPQVLRGNALRHREEYDLYRAVYSADVARFGFLGETLYVSPNTYRMYRERTREVLP
jgi:hypothetical protein